MIRFRVNGTPAPQGSKRHVGGGRMIEQSKAVGPWREAVKWEVRRSLHEAGWFETAPFEFQPLAVTIVFILKRPAGHLGTGRNAGRVRDSAPPYPATKKRNDLDKLVRCTLDGLGEGGAFADDGLVVSLSAAKVYARDGEAPGALIEVEAMT